MIKAYAIVDNTGKLLGSDVLLDGLVARQLLVFSTADQAVAYLAWHETTDPMLTNAKVVPVTISVQETSA